MRLFAAAFALTIACSPPAHAPKRPGGNMWGGPTLPPPVAAVRGTEPVLRSVDPLEIPKLTAWRPEQYPVNVHYRPVLRYRTQSGAGRVRLALSPDEKGLAVGTDVIDELVVLPKIEDVDSQVVLHLGNYTAYMKAGGSEGYHASFVAWCARPTPRVYVAESRALWSIDASTFETLPGFPQHRTAWRRRVWALACLPDGGLVVSEGHGGPKSIGYITVLEPDGSERWSVQVCHFTRPSDHMRSLCTAPPISIGLTNQAKIVVRSREGIRVLDPGTGKTLADLDALAEVKDKFGDLNPTYRGRPLGGTLLAASPTNPEILVVTSGLVDDLVGTGQQPWRVTLPDFTFHQFDDLAELVRDDARRLANSSRDPALSHFERAMNHITALAYSPDGRTIVVGGVENEHVWSDGRNWNRKVLWVLHDGKLIDTLVMHTGFITDIVVLSDGRIISVDYLTMYPGSDIIVWAPKTEQNKSWPVQPGVYGHIGVN